MRRRAKGIHGGSRAGLRTLLCFLLTCSLLSCGVPFAIADDAAGGGTSTTQPGTPDPGTGGGTPAPSPTIGDVGIFYADTDTCLGYATHPDSITAQITAKGGVLQFDSVIYWSDGSTNRNAADVAWSTSNPSIATVNSTGTLTAVSDGSVQVLATVGGSKTSSGVDLVASAWIQVSGQTDARYVSAIRVIDQEGGDITGGIHELKQDLSTAQERFGALVDVVDPATGAVQTYSTADGQLSAQAPDLSDIVWSVGDSNMAAVDETTGLFRPAVYGLVSLMATSTAGLGNSRVTGSTTVDTIDPSGQMQGDGYHPQDSLTVKAYYELYPPTQYGDAAYVIDRTYSVDEIESLGLVTATYTSLGANDYYTMTGVGTPFSTLLADAGVNLDGVKSFAFQTADWPSGENRPVSASFVFADRYWYPNIDIGSYAEAQQVYPILAVKSNEIKNGNCDPNYDMSEGTRFRLLFGATTDGSGSQYQIKWINTIYVVLSGGPAVQPGENPGGGTGTGGGGTGTGGTVGDGSGTGSEGIGAAAGTTDGVGVVQASSGSAGGTEDVSDEALAGGGDNSADSGEGRFSIYQVMNADDSVTQTTIDFDNPWKRAALPVGAAIVVLGGAEALVWFKLQMRRMAPG